MGAKIKECFFRLLAAGGLVQILHFVLFIMKYWLEKATIYVFFTVAVNVVVCRGAACLSNSDDGLVKLSADAGRANRIFSPLFPNATYPNMKCGWHIEAPSGLLVRLYGFSYLIENTPDCSKESLTFYDGADSSGKVLLQLCKTLSKYFSIYSSGNVIFVQLQTAVGSSGTKVMIRYKAVAPNLDPGCTGGNPVKRIIQVKKPSVSVSNPFEPFDLPVNWQCNWIIEAPQGHIVKMKFKERFFFRRPECYSTADANYTFYKIYNSNETDSEMLLSCQLLNKLGSDPLYSSGRYLYIQLTSRKDWTLANEYADLKIVFEPVPVGTSCSTSNSAIQNENIVLSSASGTITSPGFPSTQPSGLKCGWKISVPKGNAIKLDFISFKLGNWRAYNNEVNVYADHFKSQSSLFRAYNKKPSFVSFSPHRFALIELDLVDKVTGEYGMRVMYKPVRQINSEKCNSGNGATIDVFGSEGVFISPENYSNKKTCRWNITVPVGYVVKLLAHRTLGSECSRSGKVYNGGNTASKILGDLCFDTSPMYSNGRHVLVEFKGIGQSGQFFGYFEAVKAAPLSFACRGHKLKTLTAPSGGIASYSYPLLYPNEVFCKWKIEVALPKLVKLTFKNFSLQESSDCEKDYLLISGRSLPGFHEQKFCGNVKPADVISIDNEMEMQFRSDLVGRSEGFEATYEAIDDESWGNCSASGIEFNQPSGYFFSPRHPGFFPPGVICTWTITAPAGRHVRLQIKMKTMPSTCDSASVIIREGADRRGKLVKRVCDSLDPPVMFSKGNRFWVQFRSASGSKQYTSGFNASYEVVRSLPLSTACSSTNPFLTLEGTTGSLASDGYPNNYSNEADCSFRLKSPSSMDAIVLTFETFDLERSEDCEADYVEVYDSINAFGESMGRFCGSTIPEPLKSSGPYMAVRFKTNGSGRYPGFKANFSTKLSTKYTVIMAVCSTLGALLLLSACCWVCKRVFDDSGNELSGGDYSGVPMVDIKQSGQQV